MRRRPLAAMLPVVIAVGAAAAVAASVVVVHPSRAGALAQGFAAAVRADGGAHDGATCGFRPREAVGGRLRDQPTLRTRGRTHGSIGVQPDRQATHQARFVPQRSGRPAGSQQRLHRQSRCRCSAEPMFSWVEVPNIAGKLLAEAWSPAVEGS